MGTGSSATVWAATWQGEDLVAKIFHHGSAQHLLDELSNLNLVKNVKGVTQLRGSAERPGDSNNVLLLSPVGKPFSLLTDNLLFADHFCELVDILKDTHENAQLVHRDLSWNNFFVGAGVALVSIIGPGDEDITAPTRLDSEDEVGSTA